jgi:hypothetical protein
MYPLSNPELSQCKSATDSVYKQRYHELETKFEERASRQEDL